MALDSKSRRAVVAGGVLALGGSGLFLASSGEEDAASDPISPTMHGSEETTPVGVDLTGKPILGQPDASLELYYWTDFQCPFCETFERETLPDLVRSHVESGQVRIVFVPIAVFGEDSLTAAIAARCVWEHVREDDPAAYWDWHEAIFARQDGKNTGWADAGNLVSYTREVDGVDADRLQTCLADDRARYQSMVESDVEFAASFGVSGTPSFLVSNADTREQSFLVGAQPLERFTAAIDDVES
ncbi:protein-disulfide isomerase [Halovivax ruber XH-70]|uniref:Protein-disulfide isomerase n=1 Tax=Halovivax ruber (strain DSM 18193 / JCM 13892 / XH-70) TaxID=797302 RepID=L0IHN1_HALRX|nr:thioredoxin domain-containing protein [Halovivax ruber]AGB17487.1 protein-disulfide isomerase [Halovivax ruber XH-70]